MPKIMKNQLIEFVKSEIPEVKFKTGEKLADYTTFGIGGCASVFLEPETKESLRKLVLLFGNYSIKWRVLGGGSNLLVSDTGISDPVVYLGNFDSIEILNMKDDVVQIKVGAGLTNKKLLAFCLYHGFSGCEFLAGIPGTVGGAVFVNAGTPMGCMADIVQCIEVLTPDGKYVEYDYVRDFSPSYRNSNIPDNFIVISAVLLLSKEKEEKVKANIRSVMKKRLDTQPLDKPSAGCIFKNPSPDMPTGFLIDKCGFKGFKIGGAQVSEKHANWIVNTGTATFGDVVTIIERIKKAVKDRWDVDLEEEIKIWS